MNFIYGVEKSLDAYKFNLLKNKQTFISQMKNCELNVRTLDEGALDEKSGMNFSEYVAILSGDNTLLEKAKVEKKVAQLESWKSAHYTEVARNRYSLESAEKDLQKTQATLSGLINDDELYKQQLKHTADGTKLNPVVLTDYKIADAEELGKKIIHLYRNWLPKKGGPDEQQIGTLYGFNLYIRQQREGYEENGLFQYRNQNILFAQSATDIKYMANSGHPNTDNPKLAARYFLNAIDKVSSLRDKYEKQAADHQKEIPTLLELSQKTFEKEDELILLRVELRRLEGEIAAKIRETQMKAVPTDDTVKKADKSASETPDNLRQLKPPPIMPPDYPGEALGM